MPSQVTVKSRYRKARCCGTCSRQDSRYCTLSCMPVHLDYVCDRYAADPKRAAHKTMCSACAFGPNGNRACAYGCSDTTGTLYCYRGTEIKG